MMTEISSNPAPTAGASTENASPNVETPNAQALTADTSANAVEKQTASPAAPTPGTPVPTAAAGASTTPVIGADGKVAYVPNFKYKAALQEKELDPFFHSLIKDADSEKKVKDLFTKVDAFDFIKGKKEYAETQFDSLLADFNHQNATVSKFTAAVQANDLSSAFRVAGITKDQIFKWTQQQLALEEMPPEQRAVHERAEQAKLQNTEWEEKFQSLEKKYEDQAVQARSVGLEVALSRPDVARFAEAWDQQGEPGSFKQLVIDEAKKVFYDSQGSGKPIDLSPEQAVAMVMKRFGKFLSLGDTGTQPPQAVTSIATPRGTPPVIPNVTGKAASPIKKVPKNLDDLKKLAKEARE